MSQRTNNSTTGGNFTGRGANFTSNNSQREERVIQKDSRPIYEDEFKVDAPVSAGLILMRSVPRNAGSTERKTQYLLLQQTHTHNFMAVMAGRKFYKLDDIDYDFMNCMTSKERDLIANSNFNVSEAYYEQDLLRATAYLDRESEHYREGVRAMKRRHFAEAWKVMRQTFDHDFEETGDDYRYPWTLPKGRSSIIGRDQNGKFIYESWQDTAVRETYEETGLRLNRDYHMLDFDRYQQKFTAGNGVNYTNVFFFASLNVGAEDNICIAENNYEIRGHDWMDADEPLEEASSDADTRKYVFDLLPWLREHVKNSSEAKRARSSGGRRADAPITNHSREFVAKKGAWGSRGH